MNNQTSNRKKWKAYCLFRLWFLLLFSALPAQGAQIPRPQTPAAAQPQRPAVLSMRMDAGKVSATIADCPMQEVLSELAARTGIVFEVRSHENPLVSVKLARVSIQEAVQRIVPGNDTIFIYGEGGHNPEQITLVRVFPRNDTVPQPSVLYLGTGAITKIDEIVDTPEQAVKALAESTSVDTKEKAVEVLVRSKSSRAVKALSGSILDPAPEVRVAAIEGLAALNARSALPDILKCLKDSQPTVRQSAATAVALLGNAGNLKDLEPLVADKNTSVAAAAENAIRKLSAGKR